jgi:signal transduction histidine kinase
MRRPSRRLLGRIADVAIPWGVGLFLALVVLEEGKHNDSSAVVLLGLALAVAQGAALAWRRRHPEHVMAVAVAGGLGVWLIAPDVVLPVAGLFAIGSLAAARPPLISLVGLAALIALSAANFFTTTVEDTVFTMGLAVGAWALGEAARNRNAAIKEEARRAASEEKAYIARELHDVIAHSVSVIVVQAAAADDVFDERPDQARAALRSIERSGREAMTELRRLLGGVRPGTEGAITGPQPGLDRVEELAEPLRAAGLDVNVRREGETAPLPAGVDLSAYRIVQEALTNTLRHARATRAEVTLSYGADSIELEVRDDGNGVSSGHSNPPGQGLVGMQERATLLGGKLQAGPLPEGGYRVRARLPVEDGG